MLKLKILHLLLQLLPLHLVPQLYQEPGKLKLHKLSALIEPDQTLLAVFNTLLAQQEGLKLSIMAILLHFNNIFIIKSKLYLLLNSKFSIYITSWICNLAFLLNMKREALYVRESALTS